MGTTMHERGAAAERGRAYGLGRNTEVPREEYDLLIAMALGVAVGTTLTLLLRRGPKGQRGAATIVRAAERGAARAGRSSVEGARRMARRGGELLDRVPMEEIGEAVSEYVDAAREAIDDVVSREVKELRKAVRRQRKRFGI